MTTESGPFDLENTRLVMGPGGESTPLAVTPSFYPSRLEKGQKIERLPVSRDRTPGVVCT